MFVEAVGGSNREWGRTKNNHKLCKMLGNVMHDPNRNFICIRRRVGSGWVELGRAGADWLELGRIGLSWAMLDSPAHGFSIK